MSRRTVFHLIRHGSHGLLDRTLAGRMKGVFLNEPGHRQAAAIASELRGLPIHQIISSPLERAQQTAAPIAQLLGLPIRTDEAFNEVDFGEWTGADFDALSAKPEWHAFNRFRSSSIIPGGEMMVEAQIRAVSRLAALHRASAEQEIAIVSHSDIIKAILAHFLAVPLDLFRRIEISPASRSVLELYDEDARVMAVNLAPR